MIKHHPLDRLERRKVNEQKKKEERAGRVWKKRRKQQLREQETEDDLRTYTVNLEGQPGEQSTGVGST